MMRHDDHDDHDGGGGGGARIAYLSMEVALEPDIPTYSGGLGVLAGDTLRAAADLGRPMLGVTLAHREGYFRQRLDADGRQTDLPDAWTPASRTEPIDARAEISVDGRTMSIRAWRYAVRAPSGFAVPVYLLDTALPENHPEDRTLTDRLYIGDRHTRLRQEAVLGLGAYAMLRALGYEDVPIVHMNEGHAALVGLAMLEAAMRARGVDRPSDDDIEAVRRRCVFTTHTPVPAGHDRFPMAMVRHVLGERRAASLEAVGGVTDDTLDMTRLALRLSRYRNAVAMRHREVSRDMFPEFAIDAITNGVHARSWTSPPFRALFDRHIPAWRDDPFCLRYAAGIPLEALREARAEAKKALLDEIERRTATRLDPDAFTLGYARRAAPYKRAGLLFTDTERLRRIARETGPIQVVFAGKAHPRDERGQAMIRQVFDAADALGADVPVLYLEDYDMTLAALMTAGVDVWLNTPRPPQEASGTSGMKAALNGVPSLSVLDGWWVEGHIEGVTGWSIDDVA
ncbi:MAG: alpha-glucan family phosphorylase, partial [Gemmatimonadota bacterium]